LNHKAARGAAIISVLCGAVVPAVLPLITDAFIDARTDVIVPAQAAFGPAFWRTFLSVLTQQSSRQSP